MRAPAWRARVLSAGEALSALEGEPLPLSRYCSVPAGPSAHRPVGALVRSVYSVLLATRIEIAEASERASVRVCARVCM
eukprot:COSAG05_NODE_354_length_10862_cov_59.954659_8_plen_79_part_00